jgi:hypothetical protein
MSNKLQTAIIISLALISFSIIYSMIIRPCQKDKMLNDCLSKTYSDKTGYKLQWEWADMCIKQYK